MYWPSELTVEDLAHVAGLSLTQARRWVAVGVLKPMRQEARRRHVFHRDEAVLAAVVKRLQQFLGEKSGTPLSVAEALRPRISGWLRSDRPHYVGPLVVTLPARGVALELHGEDVAGLMERLDDMTTARRSR
jgi:hypothetical protein